MGSLGTGVCVATYAGTIISFSIPKMVFKLYFYHSVLVVFYIQLYDFHLFVLAITTRGFISRL